MTKYFSLFTTALIVFFVSLTIASWNFLLMVCHLAFALFNLPFDSWERAKEIEQRVVEEGTD